MNLTKLQLLLLSILSGLLLFASWPVIGCAPLLFIGFVPLLIVRQTVADHPQKFSKKFLFGCCYLGLLTWNALTTFWVWNASAGGGCLAIGANTLLMSTVILIAHNVSVRLARRYTNRWIPYLVFIAFWISFEYFHQHWDLTWTWLTLGNGFASSVWMVQWYEYTGVFGGSLWVLVVNVLIAEGIRSGFKIQNLKFNVHLWKRAAMAILVPVAVSLALQYFPRHSTSKTIDVAVVQPNIDPYNEKFTESAEEQLQRMLQQGATHIDNTTDYLVFPETAIAQTLWENDMQQTRIVGILQQFLKNYPRLKIVIGAVTAYQYKAGEEHTETAKRFKGTEQYYEDYNTALQFDSTGRIQKYHKSRFVPGVEKMPFPALFKPLEKLAIDLGGTAGSLCGQEERSLLYSSDSSVRVAPVICYESIFGEFVGDYVRKGANIIFIITNDGWWGDTPGYKQHLAYARLRAIENRMYIARSANTGTSCFIDPMGNVEQATKWWEPAVIHAKIKTTEQKTFYGTYGDYIAKFFLFASLCLFLAAILSWFRK